MDRRFIGFMILAFVILLANAWIVEVNRPPEPPEDQKVAQEDKPADQDAAPDEAGEGKPAAAEPATDGQPTGEPTADEAAAEGEGDAEQPADEEGEKEEGEPAVTKAEPTWATLGSVDAEDDYKLLITLTSRGGALERIELSEKAYRDLEDRAGYLGHLELGVAERGAGAQIRVVGQGTPAAKIGLKVGDVITQLNGLPIAGPAGFKMAMMETKPKQTVKLTIERDGATQEVDATLTRKPLELISPESTDGAPQDPLSLRVTLA
ncbi:MAG: PDZ domain-containing protein, partial [Planctomycetales bacterium]|nr:PDZ domain-containing protein [Planctomycetales bacterium]